MQSSELLILSAVKLTLHSLQLALVFINLITYVCTVCILDICYIVASEKPSCLATLAAACNVSGMG